MSYTKEQLIDAYKAGFLKAVDRGTFGSPAFARDMAFAYAEEYVADRFSKSGPDAPPVTGTVSRTDDRRVCEGLYLPPDGTPEEVLARVLGSFMCRAFMVFCGDANPETAFNANWYWPAMDALRTAYPVLGAVEDARVEETV